MNNPDRAGTIEENLLAIWSLLHRGRDKEKFGTSKNFRYIEKPKKGDPQEWSGFSIIFPKYQCVSNTSCKTKQTQWAEDNNDRHQETYGRRSRLAN